MTAVLLAHDVFNFADGNGGHSCNLGSAPAVGDVDILCVNSNTTVSTPAGFALDHSAVTNQGAYVFRRTAAGGESSTVTVTTNGNHETDVCWSRWDNLTALDTHTATQANGSAGSSTPAHSTGALAATGELVLAFGALHNTGAATQNPPVWSSGYTALDTTANGSGLTGVRAYVAYRIDAGTAAEAPQVSWSGDTAGDRYMLAVSWTTVSGATVTGDLAGALPALGG